MTIRQLQDKARSKRSILLKKSRIGLTRALRKAYGAVGSVQTKTRPSAFIPPIHMTDYQKKGGSCYSVGFGTATLFPADFMKRTYYLTGRSAGEPAIGYLDEPKVHALWLDDRSGRGGVLLASLDTVGLLHADVEKIRDSLSEFSETTGCRGVHILCTGCHSGFDTMGIWSKRPRTAQDREYMCFLYDQVRAAAIAAYRSRRDGQLYHAAAHVPHMQEDDRMPHVYSDLLTRIRFVPKDGTSEVWLVHFSVSTDTLRGAGTRISADFPAYMRDAIRSKTGAETFYCIGAAAGVHIPAPDESDPYGAQESFATRARRTGEKLAAYVMGIENDKKMPVSLNLLTQPLYLDVDNTLLLTAKLMRVLQAESFYREDTSMGVATRSELTYMTIGKLAILLTPGSLFPELVSGGYFNAEQSPTGRGAEENPMPLQQIAEDPGLLVVGLADDQIGPVIAPNDFLLHPDTPYLAPAVDRQGRARREEQVSLGAKTAQTIADTFAGMMREVRAAQTAAQQS